ncbi:ornithine carbamoyltransferase [Paenibacillus kobensis]|uniref:ornithine carbamoyltransferase n=1 Tax=Paenibacillus kobensis TaxID=59841 RepID=UPI000FD9F02E|nr:ornithine carbamoyltransferase [Paenibacillus kobensis]
MHLLDLHPLSSGDVIDIFDLARRLQYAEKDRPRLLEGKTFVLFFPEISVRTRITFEKGIKDLGGESILFPPATLDRRESLKDTVKYIENWADGIIVRHPDFSVIDEMARHSAIPVINAMTSDNHPCEILADLYSIRELKGQDTELVYTFVGPAGNIARSWAHIAKVMNLPFHHVCAAGHELMQSSPNYTFHTELEPVLRISDIVLTDSLPSSFRTAEYINSYQITLERMRMTKKGALLNPCPPFFRTEEVSEEVMDSPYFVGHAFKRNLIYVQQAIICYCLSKQNDGGE